LAVILAGVTGPHARADNPSFGPVQGIVPESEQFRGLGTPRGFWLGLRYTFGNTQARD
jgi:hypothetical protein